MLTNSHFEEEPENIPVLQTLNVKESFFNAVIPYLEKPYYFQFENGSLYLNSKKKRNKMDFEENIDNMNNFLTKLINLNSIPTKNSVNVCIERMQQRMLFTNLFKKRELLISKKKLIEENKKLILESKIKIIEDPTIEIENYEYEYITRPLPDGKHNTVCKVCKENCHENCKDTRIFGVDFLKYWCVCYGKAGNCKICKKKCFMSKHEYVKYEYYLEKKVKKLTLDQIFEKKCEKNPQEKNAIDKLDDIIKKNNEEIKEIENQASEMLQELTNSLEKLDDLALNELNIKLCLNIFDDLIKQEEYLENKNNIKILKQKKKEYTLLSETEKKSDEKIISHYSDRNDCNIF